MGMFSGIQSFIDTQVTSLRDANLSKTEIEERKDAKRVCEAAKLVSVVAGGILAAFAASYLTFAGFFFASFIGVVAHDSYRVADNLLKILHNARKEAQLRVIDDKEQRAVEFTKKLIKDTILFKHVAKMVEPDLFPGENI